MGPTILGLSQQNLIKFQPATHDNITRIRLNAPLHINILYYKAQSFFAHLDELMEVEVVVKLVEYM